MKKISNKVLITDYDKLIFFSYFGLLLIGLFMMLDISSARNSMIYFYRQFAYAIVSFVLILFVLYKTDILKVRKWTLIFVIITMALLVLVLLKGEKVKGATRGLNLGIVNFQPSFLARLVLVFFIANVIDKKRELLKTASGKLLIKELFPLFFVTAILYGLILKGQHFSSLVISAGTIICMMFLGGIRLRFILIFILICFVGGYAILKAGAAYRSERLDIYRKYCLFFRNNAPEISEDKEYQVRESLTALTTGKLIGIGAARGRAKHYYLPEVRTDYVFTVIGEEFGFLGAIIVFGLHCFLFFKVMLMAYRLPDFYQQMLAIGLALNIFLNVLVNVGVSMSILPSTGNTLPFISYGGTALMIDSLSIGIILNLSAKRKVF